MTAVLDAPAVPVLGREEPRLFTRPLRPLTPETTLGFEAVDFAGRVLGLTLLPWQQWWLMHALELRPDGSFRFRTVLTLVARQNGKTHLLKIVSLYFMFMGRARLVLGAAQSLDIAKEAWSGAVDLTRDVDELHDEVESVRLTNGEQEMRLVSGARYRIAATHRAAGRGLSVDLLILDELREHRDWLAWAALSKTTTARPNAIIVGISNAGDDESVVLNSLRSSALGGDDETLALFEWSAPDGCDLDDVEGWAAANPGLGRTVSEAAIRSAMNQDPPAVFRTESLCQRVDALDAAIDPAAWDACSDRSGSLAGVRERVVACIDVAPDGQHVTLAGAAVLDDGRVRVEVFRAWKTTEQARVELPELLGRIKPAATAWFPAGPAAALAADLRALDALEIKGAEVGEACQEMADLVLARRVVHPDDALLSAHVAGSQKLRAGEGWRFQRRGHGHVDAAYAAAGAIHTARTLPPPVKKPKSRIFV